MGNRSSNVTIIEEVLSTAEMEAGEKSLLTCDDMTIRILQTVEYCNRVARAL